MRGQWRLYAFVGCCARTQIAENLISSRSVDQLAKLVERSPFLTFRSSKNGRAISEKAS
jgi:hypothetical protein